MLRKTYTPILRLLALCLLAHPLLLMSQTYVNKEWSQTTGLPGNIDWSASAVDPQGNIIVVGNTLVAPGNPDVLISKFNRDGDLLWQQQYHGNTEGEDYGTAVATDYLGNCYVAATVSNEGTAFDVAVLKYDPEGVLVWHTEWNGAANLYDVPSSIALDGNGAIYVAGTTYSSATNPDYLALKLSPAGAIQWASTYDYAGFPDVATGISFDLLMDPVVTGGSANSINSWDYATVRFNKMNGFQTAVERVNVPGVGMDNALAFTRDNAGSLFITGYREVNGNKDIQTVKLSNSFTLAWVVNFDGEGLEDVGKAIGADNLGNIYVAGYTRKSNGGSDYITIKYDASGNVLWQERYRARKDEWKAEASKLAVTPDGGVLVVGSIFDGEKDNFVTVKYSADGKLEWEKEYDGLNGDDRAMDVVSIGKEAYVSGITGEGPDRTYSMVKYSYTTVKDSAVMDINGIPQCMDRQLIVNFRRLYVNTDWVNKREIEYGTLKDALDPGVADEVANKLGISSGGKLNVYKVFRGITTADSISISRLGEEVRMPEFWRILKIGLPPGIDLPSAIDSLNTLDAVAYAQVNNLYQFYDIPNDPLLNHQPSLVPNATYSGADINVDPAWDIQAGIPEVKVGIVDDMIEGINRNGVGYNEGVEDLGEHVVGGYDFPFGGFQENYQEFYPFTEHGTACAGIVGAIRNNGIGVAGIAGGTGETNTGCSLYSVGIVDGYNYLTLDQIAPAIVDASTDGIGYDWIPGCNILNISWGQGAGFYSFSPALIQAVVNAYHHQCVFVAARGNVGTPAEQTAATYPSCYGGLYLDENGILSVGASGTDGRSMTYTNGPFYTQYGQGMDLVAPGATQLIVSTVGHNSPNFPNCEPGLPYYYDCFRGTSAAAPHVTGVAALMMSEHNVLNGAANDLAPEDVEHIMEATATDELNGPGTYDEPNGWGRLNAGEAVRQVASPYRVFHSGPTQGVATSFPSETINVSSWVNAWSGSWDLPPGNYTAARTQMEYTYSNTFGPDFTVLGVWDRESSTRGISGSPNLDGRYNASYVYDIDPSTATVNVTAITNCWYVIADANGNPVNQWIPDKPDNLKTAYSVHLLGPDINVSVTDGPTPTDFSAYPSPTSDLVNIRLPNALPANATLDVFDIAGRAVAHRSLGPDIRSLQIPVEGWARGVYCLRLKLDGSMRTTRFVKH